MTTFVDLLRQQAINIEDTVKLWSCTNSNIYQRIGLEGAAVGSQAKHKGWYSHFCRHLLPDYIDSYIPTGKDEKRNIISFNNHNHKEIEDKKEYNKAIYTKAQETNLEIFKILRKVTSETKIYQKQLAETLGITTAFEDCGIVNENNWVIMSLINIGIDQNLLTASRVGNKKYITPGPVEEYLPIEPTFTPGYQHSIGESRLANYFITKNIPFIPQKKYPDCRDKRELPYDFLVLIDDVEYLIEVQGEQHYSPIEHFGGEEGYALRKHHDELKKQYAVDHEIPLLELKYDKKHDPVKEFTKAMAALKI